MDLSAKFPSPSTSATTAPNKQTPEEVGFLCIEGIKHPLRKGVNRIGRNSETSHIVLPLQTVSRDHAVIEILNSKKNTIMDMNSANKTKLSGNILRRYHPYPLKNGDKLHFGEVIGEFRLLDEENNLPETQPLFIPDMPYENNGASMMPCITITDTPEERIVISPIIPCITITDTPEDEIEVISPIIPCITITDTSEDSDERFSPTLPCITISDTSDDSNGVLSPPLPLITITDTPDGSNDVISPPLPCIVKVERVGAPSPIIIPDTPEESDDLASPTPPLYIKPDTSDDSLEGLSPILPGITFETPESSSDECDYMLPSQDLGY